MSMITELIGKLKNIRGFLTKIELHTYAKSVSEAIDTIETLSAKVRANNMHGGWIPVEEKLPKDCENVLVYFEYYRYGDYNKMFKTIGISYTFEGKWSGIINGQSGWTKSRIIAWMPIPEPYKEV